MPQPKPKTPGEYVVGLFGRGAQSAIARELKVDRVTVLRWAPWPRKRPVHNMEGIIPQKWYRPLLRFAKKKNIRLTHDELVYGPDADEQWRISDGN